MKTLIIDDNLVSIKDVSFCLHARYPDVKIVSAELAIHGIELSGFTSFSIMLNVEP